MSNNTNKGSSGKDWLSILLGFGLMIGGGIVANMEQPEFLQQLAQQGIPLNFGTTIAAIGVFLILFPVIRMFFIAPLAEAIGNRTNELERTFSEAEQLRAEMTAMRTEYEQRIAATEAEAREQIQNQIREAQALRQSLMAEATAKADEMVHRAQQEIENEKHRVMSELRLSVVDLTLAATEKVLGENIDNDRNRRLVNDFIDKVEVPS